jgi:hypothetical protein
MNSSRLSFEQAINQVSKEYDLGSDIERQKQIIQQFHNIPFWRWDLPDVDKHYQLYRQRKCPCFNCKIKWPVKNNRVYPLFDYQYRYLSALEQQKLVACIKCRASGISEVTLRYMEWLSLRNRKLAGSQFIIVSAPAEELSLSFMRRIRQHLEPIFGNFESREKTLVINDVRFQTMPSHNLLQLRGITHVSFLTLEESSFWHPNEEREILPIILPLRQKNKDIQISLISTPGRIGSLMHQIHLASQDKTPFHKIYIDWRQVVGKLFSHQEIEEASRTNVAFEREMNLAFGFGMGTLFAYSDLQAAVELGRRYADPSYNPSHLKMPYPYTLYPGADSTIGIDTAGGSSSQFAIVGLQIWNRHVHVFAAEAYTRPNFDQMIDRVMELWQGTSCQAKIYVDSSNPGWIRLLKARMSPLTSGRERVDFENYIQHLREKGHSGDHDMKLGDYMSVVPVVFSTHAPRLLQAAAFYVQRHLVAIHPDFKELIEDLHSARTKEHASNDWQLDKNQHSHDLLDALRTAMYDFRVERPKIPITAY